MSNKLPSISGQRDRIVFSVPLHKTIKKGTLKAILKQAGISVEELKGKISHLLYIPPTKVGGL